MRPQQKKPNRETNPDGVLAREPMPAIFQSKTLSGTTRRPWRLQLALRRHRTARGCRFRRGGALRPAHADIRVSGGAQGFIKPVNARRSSNRGKNIGQC